VTNKTKEIRIATDLFASGEIITTQITITKNTWCTRSGVLYGVRYWSFFWNAAVCLLVCCLVWSDLFRVFVRSELLCDERSFWSALCWVFVLFCSVLSVPSNLICVVCSSFSCDLCRMFIRPDRLTLEPCFSPTQEEAHVTHIQLYPQKLFP
jgi:hypothetical protein